MVATKAQQKDALKHILENVFAEEANGPIARALSAASIQTVLDMTAMRYDDIYELNYIGDDSTTVIDLPKYKCSLILLFASYLSWLDRAGRPVEPEPDGWITITHEDFSRYRITPDALFFMNNGAKSSPTTQPSNKHSTPDPVEHFKRGIKRDVAQFRNLKDDALWDSWNAHTLATAQAQDVAEVLDPTYVPPPTEVGLFQQKRLYMYSVLLNCLDTDQGQTVIRTHAATSDAQKAYADMREYCLRSAKAELNAADHLAYITNAKLGNGQWRGTAESFILNWQDRLRKHTDTLKDKSAALHDTTKLALLQNAVSLIPQLNDVKLRADQYNSATKQATTYAEYVAFLVTASQQYDRTNSQAVQPSRQKVYLHEAHDHQHDTLATVQAYNIDTMISPNDEQDVPIYAYQTHTGSSTRLRDTTWSQLKPNDRRTWNHLSTDGKLTILSDRPSDPSPPPFRPGEATHFERKVNHEGIADTEETNERPNEKDKKMHPEDLQHMLPSPTPTDKTQDETVINGIRYRRCSCHETTSYRADTASRGKKETDLVDRGANGGIAGENLRVIEQTGRTVNVAGIDNHQLIDIPIVTAGGVTQSHKGPVITIFHQYACTGRGKSVHSSAQLEWYKNTVDDKAKANGGMQRIITPDGYIIPISIRGGLAYIPMRTFTDKEFETLPHVIMTSDKEWDPSILDGEVDIESEEWFDTVITIPTEEVVNNKRFDKFFDKGFVNTFENNIRARGAMYKLINDSARPEVQGNVKDIIRSLSVQKWQWEAHPRRRNPTKGKAQNMKRTTNGIMGRTVTPASCWLLTVLYVRFLLNLLVFSVLTTYILVGRMTCSTHDTSPLLWFRWYKPVCYTMRKFTFTLNPKETLGRFVRIAEHVGNTIQPDARQHRQHMMLSIHHVRGAMATMLLQSYHYVTNINPAGIFKKHRNYSDACDDYIPNFTGWLPPPTSLQIMGLMAQSAVIE
ncbi:hypothetical protein IV203_023870 [Nitzschia inconspicua]|uniref:Uncharacterized protein n=1 Tax=Nitzschia inconspicua TaxID=303405 RepID=A0A9K3KB67_9STRA|nr:hypothetical protein IV203_023870 [Nitzschia inconspicua]